MKADQVDWEALTARAVAMTDRSYAPYSRVRVGAAALCEDGSIHTGCNVENASTGIGICAEVNLCGQMVASREGKPPRPVAIAVVAGDQRPIAPCGRCRQFLFEFGGPELLVQLDGRVTTLGELLPEVFGPGDVASRADR